MPNTYSSVMLYNADGTGKEYGNNATGSDIYAPFEMSPTVNDHFAGTYIRWKNDKVYRCKVDIPHGTTLVDTGNNANVEIPTDIPDDTVTHTPEEGVYSVSGMVEAINAKQDASDTNLQTTAKTVVGGINELNASLAVTVSQLNGSFKTEEGNTAFKNLGAVPSDGAYYILIGGLGFGTATNIQAQCWISGGCVFQGSSSYVNIQSFPINGGTGITGLIYGNGNQLFINCWAAAGYNNITVTYDFALIRIGKVAS